MAIKTYEELLEMLGVLAQWAHARKTLDDAQAECADCFRVLREAERKLSEAVMSVADSADPDEDDMALEANAKKTEHSGAKNMAHDKPAKRADLKNAARKLRREAGKRAVREDAP